MKAMPKVVPEINQPAKSQRPFVAKEIAKKENLSARMQSLYITRNSDLKRMEDDRVERRVTGYCSF